jgi:hypothetical protein
MQINEFDQLSAFARDLAKILAAYKKHLLQEGFTSMEAMMLIAAYQAEMINGQNRRS